MACFCLGGPSCCMNQRYGPLSPQWSPEQSATLTVEEMERAVDAFVKAQNEPVTDDAPEMAYEWAEIKDGEEGIQLGTDAEGAILYRFYEEGGGAISTDDAIYLTLTEAKFLAFHLNKAFGAGGGSNGEQEVRDESFIEAEVQ